MLCITTSKEGSVTGNMTNDRNHVGSETNENLNIIYNCSYFTRTGKKKK